MPTSFARSICERAFVAYSQPRAGVKRFWIGVRFSRDFRLTAMRFGDMLRPLRCIDTFQVLGGLVRRATKHVAAGFGRHCGISRALCRRTKAERSRPPSFDSRLGRITYPLRFDFHPNNRAYDERRPNAARLSSDRAMPGGTAKWAESHANLQQHENRRPTPVISLARRQPGMTAHANLRF